MPKAAQHPDALTNLAFPIRGIEVTTSFDMQPALTTALGVNVRAYEPLTLRDRGGQRPGLEAYLAAIPTLGVIQHLDYVVDPQADALIADADASSEVLGIDYIDDPSTNHLKLRNPGRRVRQGGSGRSHNKNIPVKLTPLITWGTPADIMVGVALSGTQLNAVATDPHTLLVVDGSFIYTPASGTVLGVGDGQQLSTHFTPTDATHYLTATKSVSINVKSGTIDTHIVNNGGLSVGLGLPLGTYAKGSNFTAKTPGGATVAGAMTVDSPSPGTVPTDPDATYPLHVTFVPDNTDVYNGSTYSDTMTVDAALNSGDAKSSSTATDPDNVISVTDVVLGGFTDIDFPDIGTVYPAAGSDHPGSGFSLSISWNTSSNRWEYQWSNS